ncbi:MAG: carbohydrate ABC transporter permease [Spirochaetales bacterium]|nr:carbohydrate ABC transporter permease [Spirochaetales bacterium]
MAQSKTIKYKAGKLVRNFIKYVVLIALAFFFLFPVMFMFVSSVKNNEMQVVSDMSSLRGFVPYGDLGFKNYLDVFKEMNFGRFMFNSLLITSVTVLAGLVFNSMLAFSLARLHFKGQKLVVSVIVALMIIPIESVVIPMLLMVNQLNWIDSYQVQIFPFIAEPFFIFLFYQFFIGIPHDFDEAAVVDGASPSMIYSRIIVPLSRPVFASVLILQSMFRWNEFLWPLMVTRGEKFRPLTVAMQQFFSQDPKLWGDIFAFASMVTFPLLILFLFFQKWFIQSVASSGIKG